MMVPLFFKEISKEGEFWLKKKVREWVKCEIRAVFTAKKAVIFKLVPNVITSTPSLGKRKANRPNAPYAPSS